MRDRKLAIFSSAFLALKEDLRFNTCQIFLSGTILLCDRDLLLQTCLLFLFFSPYFFFFLIKVIEPERLWIVFSR